MTHIELVTSLNGTLVRMCHTRAAVLELHHKIKRNLAPLVRSTPASKAAYVVSLDRLLDGLARTR